MRPPTPTHSTHSTSSPLPLTRRQALAGLAAAAALAAAPRALRAQPQATTFPATGAALTLPPLPYAADALEPHLDARTMELHHGRHHQAYINNANRLLADHAALRALGPVGLLQNLEQVPAAIRQGVIDNIGGHENHAFFWPLLAAPRDYRAGPLQAAITREFGSLHAFKQKFATAAATRFGSGWAWLSSEADSSLVVHSTANQDSPWMENRRPVLGLDVWEHAYYLAYKNRRADYVTAFWSILNWDQAETNYAPT